MSRVELALVATAVLGSQRARHRPAARWPGHLPERV